MFRGLRTWGLWLLPLALLMTACSSDDNTGNNPDAGTITDAGTGTDAGTQAIITIQGFTFSPETLEVAPGTTVRVVNRDSAQHSVTSTPSDTSFTPGAVNGVSFDTGEFTGERSFLVPTSAPSGTVVPYYCTAHGSSMGVGHIRVK